MDKSSGMIIRMKPLQQFIHIEQHIELLVFSSFHKIKLGMFWRIFTFSTFWVKELKPHFHLLCWQMSWFYSQVPLAQILLFLGFVIVYADDAVSHQVCFSSFFVSCTEDWPCLLFFLSLLNDFHLREAVTPAEVHWSHFVDQQTLL